MKVFASSKQVIDLDAYLQSFYETDTQVREEMGILGFTLLGPSMSDHIRILNSGMIIGFEVASYIIERIANVIKKSQYPALLDGEDVKHAINTAT